MNTTYKPVTSTFSDCVNKSQYFNPFFSFLTVSYIYFAIGIRSDTIWKYLFHVVNCAFFANLFSIAKQISKDLGYYHFEYFKHLVWIETIFFGINEWGYVFINYIKIKTCIKSLKSKLWTYFIYLLLVYTLIIRLIITYYELQEEQGILNGEVVQEKSVKFHSILYTPMGILEFIFLYLIIVNLLREDDNKYRNILNILLHSSLSRMFTVSLLLFAISIIVWFPNEGVAAFIRRFLWRLKGYLGIIFLVDLLLLRIEIDNNEIIDRNNKIKKINLENSIQNSYRMSPTSEYPSPLNGSNSIKNDNYKNHNLNNTNNIPSPSTTIRYSTSPYSPSRNFNENIFRSSVDNRETILNSPSSSVRSFGVPSSPQRLYPNASSNGKLRPSNIVPDEFVYNNNAVKLKSEIYIPKNADQTISENNNVLKRKSMIDETQKLFR